MRISRTTWWLVAFAMMMLFTGVMIRSGIMVDKSYLPRIFSLALVLLIVLFAGFHGKYIRGATLFTLIFMVFYGWNLLSCTWAVSFSEAIMQSQLVFLALAVFLVVFDITSRYPVFEAIFIKMHLFVLLFSFGLAFYRMGTLEFYDPYQIISVSANNNLYSGFLLLSLPLLFAGYSLLKGGWKYLSVIVGILALFFLIIIRSRAAYLGLVVAVITAGAFMVWKWKTVFSGRNILTGTMAMFLLIAALGLFYYAQDETRKSYFLSKIQIWNYLRSYDDATVRTIEKLKSRRTATNGQVAAFDFAEDYHETASLRVIFWKKSFHLVRVHPWIGVGAGNWKIMIPSSPLPANPEHTIKNYTYSQPHNEYIGLLAELGIIGLLLALALLFLPVGAVFYRIIRHHRPVSLPALFYASFIAGFYLFCFFDFPLKRVEHNVVLFSMMAFMLHRVPLSSVGMESSRNIPAWIQKTLIAALLVFTLAISFFRMRGEYYTLKVFVNERWDDRKVAEYSRHAEGPFYRVTPNTLPIAWFEGVAQYRLAHIPLAAACFERALKSTPYEVRVLNDYGISLYNLNRTDEATKVLRQCIYLDPWFEDAKFNLCAIFFGSGQHDSARYYLDQCLDSPKKTTYLNELNQIFPR